MKKYKGNYSVRLSIFTVVGTIIMFTILFSVFYVVMKKQCIQASIDNTLSLLDNMELRIDSHLKKAQVTVDNAVWMIEDKLNDEAQLKHILRQRLINNPELVSAEMAFEPNVVPSKGRKYMLTANRGKDGVKCQQVTDDLYDYFSQDWYLIPKLLKKSGWSEPYFYGKTRMCTYSSPLKRKDGTVYGVLSVNISLEDFSNIVKKLQPIKNSSSFLLSRNGYYITNQDKEKILNETVLSNAYERKDSSLAVMGTKMINGERGYYEFQLDGVNYYAFFSPISSSGWSVCNICQESIILSSLNRTLLYIVLLFVLCIVIFFAAIAFVSKRFISELKSTTASNERIKSELHIAQSIQMGMIPKIFPPFPDRNDVDLYAILRPAKEVGGDLYDFFIANEMLYFTVGDVSGKGVPASLFMAVTRSLFRNIAAQEISPGEIVDALNNTVAENNDSNMFVTMLVGRLDLISGRLVLCNAGHNPPVIFNSETGNVRFMEVKKNLPVGLMGGFPYQEEEHELGIGDRMLIYTDGVTEAENDEKKQYGEDLLIGTIRNNMTQDVKQLTETVLNSIVRHADGAEQSDDITIMNLYYRPEDTTLYHKSLLMENKMVEVKRLAEYVEQIGEDLHIGMKTQTQLNLALEEAVVNVINYAYPASENGKIGLQATYAEDERKLKFVLSDSGTPFNPTNVPEVDVTKKLEDRQIGGLGIFLVKQMMDTVEYRYFDKKNELFMTKIIDSAEE